MDTNELDLAWLAGFMDGEGSFHFRRAAGQRLDPYNYYYPSVRIANTHEATLVAVRAILDAAGLEYNFYWRHPTNGNQSSWDIEVRSNRRIQKWLTLLIPYLRTKQAQAKDMLRFIELRGAVGSPQTGYSEEEMAILQRMSKRAVIRPRLVRPVADECANGHALVDDNVYEWNGQRHCRACRRDANQREAERRKEQRHAKRRALVEQAPGSSG